MDYQSLSLKGLKDLLRDRDIAGRSKATTKEKAIALLEECDRLSAENAPVEETPVEETPVEETPVEETLISREVRHYIYSAGEWLDENDEWTTEAAKACPYPISQLQAKLAELRRSGKKGLEAFSEIVENFTGSPPSPPAPPVEPEPEPEPEVSSSDAKAECLKATLEKAAKLKSLMGQTLAPAEKSTEAPCFNANLESSQKINRRERIETSSIQSPSGASVNQDCFQETRCSSTSADEAIIPQQSDDNKNNSDCAEKLAEQIWRSSLEFIDHNGQPAKRVSSLEAEILVNLSSDSIYRLIIFDTYGQVIIMSPPAASPSPATELATAGQESPSSATAGQESPSSATELATAGQESPSSATAGQELPPSATASPPASKFFLSFVTGGGRRFWLGYEDSPTPNPSRAEAYSERHAKAKAAYHRQFPQEFPNIQIFERSHNNQWYEHQLVRAAKSWRERSIYEVIPVNPIDLSPRSPPCTA